jgi:hypothetical protein
MFQIGEHKNSLADLVCQAQTMMQSGRFEEY